MVIAYSLKMGPNLIRSAKKIYISVALSASNKLIMLRTKIRKCSDEQPRCKTRHRIKFITRQGRVAYAISHSWELYKSAKLVDASTSGEGTIARYKNHRLRTSGGSSQARLKLRR